jgi:hypothetical protein
MFPASYSRRWPAWTWFMYLIAALLWRLPVTSGLNFTQNQRFEFAAAAAAGAVD